MTEILKEDEGVGGLVDTNHHKATTLCPGHCWHSAVVLELERSPSGNMVLSNSHNIGKASSMARTAPSPTRTPGKGTAQQQAPLARENMYVQASHQVTTRNPADPQ